MIRKMNEEEKRELLVKRKNYEKGKFYALYIIGVVTIYLLINHFVVLLLKGKIHTFMRLTKAEIVIALIVYSVLILFLIILKMNDFTKREKEEFIAAIDEELANGIVEEEEYNFTSAYLVNFESDEEEIQMYFDSGAIVKLENGEMVYVACYYEVEDFFPHSRFRLVTYPKSKEAGVSFSRRVYFEGDKVEYLGEIVISTKQEIKDLFGITFDKSDLDEYEVLRDVNKDVLEKLKKK